MRKNLPCGFKKITVLKVRVNINLQIFLCMMQHNFIDFSAVWVELRHTQLCEENYTDKQTD